MNIVTISHTGDSVPRTDTSILTGVAQFFGLPDGQMRQLFVISIFIVTLPTGGQLRRRHSAVSCPPAGESEASWKLLVVSFF